MSSFTSLTWPCRICTFENVSDASQCAMCSTSRSRKDKIDIVHSKMNKNNVNDDENENENDISSEWQCTHCSMNNSSSTNKCSMCYRRRSPIFSPDDIAQLNEFADIHFNRTLSPSHSAPNTMNNINIINNNKNTNNRNKKTKQTKHSDHDNKRDRSSSLNRQRITNSSEIFDLYTNRQNKLSLLPLDIQISSRPKLGPPTVRVHYDEDFNPSTSPSPSSSISSNHTQFFVTNGNTQNFEISAPPSLAPMHSTPSPEPIISMIDGNGKSGNNAKHKNRKHKKRKHSLPLMEKMVRKYSDPKDQSTTTLLITPQKPDEYSLEKLKQSMNIIDAQIVEILHKRHDNEYYQYIIDKTRYKENDIDMITKSMNCSIIDRDYKHLMILMCNGCKTKMVHTKCPDSLSTIQCYECGVYITKLGMEYYHCPNVQLSLHQDIGRDLCCICGVKNIIKQDHQKKKIVITQNKNNMDMEEEMVSYDNYIKYQTHKFEQIIPSILKISKLDDFEYIYEGITAQTKLENNSDIISLLHSHSSMLETQLLRLENEITKSKSNKNDIQNECQSISNDITKVSAEITTLMKKINVLIKKKQDLQSQMQGIMDVLNTMNNHEHQLSIISSKTHGIKHRIDQRIKCIEKYDDKVSILQTAFTKKRTSLFGKWQNWTTQKVILQLQHYLKINNIKLNALDIVIQQFESRCISGKDLINLNELTFKMMDITDSLDQKALSLWIKSVTSGSNKYKHKNKKMKLITNIDIDQQPQNDDNHDDEDMDEEEEEEENKMDLSSPNSPPISTKNNLLCSICMENVVNVILNPCGHISICSTCSRKMVKQTCPVCRVQIEEVKFIYFASR